MLKVYSPEGVSCRLWNSAVSAAATDPAASARLQRNQVVRFNVVAAIVGAFAVEIEIGWTVNAAELRFLRRLPCDRNHDCVGRNHAAFLVIPIIELAVDAAAAHSHPHPRH